MNPDTKKNNEKFHELGEMVDESNSETKTNIDSSILNKRPNFLLNMIHLWKTLPTIYKAMAYIALFNLIIIAILFYYSS